PDPAAFFVVIDLPETFIARRPAVRGGAAVGWWGTKNVELVDCNGTFSVAIETLYLLGNI
ncbi:MAG: hypothetical protein LBL45_05280, partial [Treponema sp.]|nr:hypothetical protein [Treponema sp.]